MADPNQMSEGEAIDDPGAVMAEELERREASERGDHFSLVRQRLVQLHDDAKSAEVGATIRCPNCEKLIVKRSYQHAFCSNKGKKSCKTKYHNRVHGLGRAVRNIRRFVEGREAVDAE